MKSISIISIILFLTFFVGCGNTKIINKLEYDTYGFINQSEKKNPDIEYQLIIGNIIWGCILVETLIAPIYFFGFSLYEPVGVKKHSKPKGALE